MYLLFRFEWMPDNHQTYQGGDVPQPEKNLFRLEQDRIGGRASPNLPSQPQENMDK